MVVVLVAMLRRGAWRVSAAGLVSWVGFAAVFGWLLALTYLTIAGQMLDLLVLPGPRDDWFVDPDALVHNVWVASDRSDRVGMRLTGTPMRYRDPERQLPSEGVTRGAIQVPPNGLPVILGPDHPVTGGYPVAGVVVDADVDKVAQIRPGQTVRLHWARPRG